MAEVAAASRAWRTAFFLLLVTWFATIGVGAYLLLDAGVTQTYFEDQAHLDREDLALLIKLAPSLRRGTTHADLLTLLREQNPSALISTTASGIEVGQLTFRFDRDGQLVAITQGERAQPAALAEPR